MLQTFGTDLGEVALQPATGGIFKVHLYTEELGASEDDEATVQEYLLWDRKAEGGFPGTALLLSLFSEADFKILEFRVVLSPPRMMN